jgi:hypothetical protein
MREAMRELGYVDTYHMMSASIENPPDALLWRDAFNAKYHNGPAFTRADWDKLLGHCQAGTAPISSHHPGSPSSRPHH